MPIDLASARLDPTAMLPLVSEDRERNRRLVVDAEIENSPRRAVFEHLEFVACQRMQRRSLRTVTTA